MSDIERPWLAHYDPEVKPVLGYDFRPLPAFLDRAAERWPKRKAILFQNNSITYAELKRLAETVAAGLRAGGVRRGDRVAIMLPNSPQSIVSYWGALKAGAVVVMTNPLYMETEMVHQFNDSGAETLITLDLLWPKVEAVRKRVGIKRFYVSGMQDGLAFPLNWLYRLKSWREGARPRVPENADVRPFRELLRGKARYSAEGVNPVRDTALLQYTGGTTGVAKGCMLTHANLVANIQQCRAVLHSLGAEHETFLGIMPYFHIYGLTVCVNFPTLLGATMVPFPRYQPLDVLRAIDKIQPTIFPGAPSLYLSLMQQKQVGDFNLHSIKFCISGSSPMPVEHIERFRQLTGADIIEGFGLSEASPVTHLNPLRGVRKPGAIGVPFPDTDAKIVDMEVGGEGLPPGKLGELVIRGPQVMKGYWNRPDDTASVLRNGWLFTGDIATMDEDGYFFIADRKKDLIISMGYNIYPREIDEVLCAHPDIKEAVAVGIPHGSRGEVVKAYVVLRPGASLERCDVIAWCKEKLAGYKVPRLVEFRAELPKTLVGKVLRRALRAEEEAKQRERKSGTQRTEASNACELRGE